MQHARLGSTTIKVSRVMLGTMARADARPERRIAVLNAAADVGIDTVDTAPLYEFGDAERWVGQTIRSRSDRPVVCTKVGLRWDTSHGEVLFERTDRAGHGQSVRIDGRAASVREQIEASRARLGVDVIDLVQVHFRDIHTPIRDTMKSLADAVRAGEVRAVGVCNFTLEETQVAQKALGHVPLASIQLGYSLLDRRVEDEILPWARREHIAMLAYAPLAEGMLTGRRFEDRHHDPRRPIKAIHRA
ncbi:MAG: aldo/keto reductase, partial [Myxococcota bacterium]